jgi:hypothetical protein
MKVLTVKQPYATLIAEGIKEYEFRTWKTKYRGEFLIHAGKGKNIEYMKKYEYLNLEYPAGYIIAKVTLEDCIDVNDDFREILKIKNPILYSHVINDKTWKGYAFKLTNVEKIENIPAQGKLSFWNFDYENITK